MSAVSVFASWPGPSAVLTKSAHLSLPSAGAGGRGEDEETTPPRGVAEARLSEAPNDAGSPRVAAAPRLARASPGGANALDEGDRDRADDAHAPAICQARAADDPARGSRARDRPRRARSRRPASRERRGGAGASRRAASSTSREERGFRSPKRASRLCPTRRVRGGRLSARRCERREASPRGLASSSRSSPPSSRIGCNHLAVCRGLFAHCVGILLFSADRGGRARRRDFLGRLTRRFWVMASPDSRDGPPRTRGRARRRRPRAIDSPPGFETRVKHLGRARCSF